MEINDNRIVISTDLSLIYKKLKTYQRSSLCFLIKEQEDSVTILFPINSSLILIGPSCFPDSIIKNYNLF